MALFYRMVDYPGSKWLQLLRITGISHPQICSDWLCFIDIMIMITWRPRNWIRLNWIFIPRVSLRCQAYNPLLPAQSFEDSLLLDIYCEETYLYQSKLNKLASSKMRKLKSWQAYKLTNEQADKLTSWKFTSYQTDRWKEDLMTRMVKW